MLRSYWRIVMGTFMMRLALLAAGFSAPLIADELPPALESAIADPAIPMIVDATILSFNQEGHAVIRVNRVYKKPAKTEPPKVVRGYAYDPAGEKIALMRVIINKGEDRFLFFLQGDLLHSTYNNRFQIREKDNTLTVNTGRGWKPLQPIVATIPK